MIIASVCLVLALELAVVGWPASSLRRLLRPRAGELWDIALLAVSILGLGATAAALLSLGLSDAFAEGAAWVASRCHVSRVRCWLTIPLFVASTDLLAYWTHRAFHTKWLWWAHRLHHEPASSTALTAFRFNPLNAVLDPAWRALPFLLFPVPASVIATAATVGMIQSLFLHSAMAWTLGSGGRWLINSPAAHRLHHRPSGQCNCNFGALFIVWDRVFGTWVKP